MNPLPELQATPFTVVASAIGIAALLLARWYYVRGLWLGRQRAGDGAEEPDRVWSAREGGPWMVTFRGEVWEIWSEDLPKGRELPRGLMSDEVFRMLARSDVTQEAYYQQSKRINPGDLIAARLFHNTSDPDRVPWRIEALDREQAHHLFGFEEERDARNVLELLKRRVLPPESALPGGVSADDAIDAARRRDEVAEEAANGRSGGE
jgi:hypothetical protein